MSLFTEASLVMIPSGVKDGKLYSIKPDDGVGDFTFTRGSNLAATRVDENGLIEKGRENLLLQSNNFSTTWTTLGSTPTGGQTGYDGSNDAWLLTKVATPFRYINQAVSTSGVQTFSVYAKANTLNFVTVFAQAASASIAKFNLVDGSLNYSLNIIDTKSENIGDGWWRLSMTFNATTTAVRIYADYEEANAGSIFIQDAQLELGLVATDYIETGATTEQAGILENLPRLDYTDSSCPSLLLEPTRSNLLVQSEYFNAANWFRSNCSVLENQIVSPDGNLNASSVTATASVGGIFEFEEWSTTQKTVSVFLKKNTSQFVRIANGSIANTHVEYDLDNGTLTTLGSITGIIEDYGNGWYRCIATHTAAANNTLAIAVTDGGSFYIYGAQLEAGSYPTSYIPTYGTSVTRSGDLCVGAGDATTFNDNEGVLFVEASGLADPPPANCQISLCDGTTSNMLRIVHFTSGILAIYNNSNLIYQFNLVLTDTLKIAVKYGNSTGDYKVYINGSSVTISGSFSATPITGLNTLDFAYPTGSSNFYGRINKAIVFPTALTDSELAALTTI